MLFIIVQKVMNMEFNSDKFELLRYRLRGPTVQNSAGYKSNIGSEIEEKAHVKDLGVKLSSDATFLGTLVRRLHP